MLVGQVEWLEKIPFLFRPLQTIPSSGVEQSWRSAGESYWDVAALLNPLERINASVSETWGKE